MTKAETDKATNADLVMAIDPGSAKCGLALVRHDLSIIYRAVVPAGELVATVRTLADQHRPFCLLIGDGTKCRTARAALQDALAIPVEFVCESHTSEAARARWVRENPPRGLERLLPRSLRTPNEPYDDWVAVILAERFWASAFSPSPLMPNT